MKKVNFASIVFYLLLSFAACKALPDVSLLSADIEDIDYNGVQILYKVQIDSFSSLGVPFPKVGWKIFIDDTFVSEGNAEDKTLVVQNTGIVDLPVDISFLDVFTALPELKGETGTDYRIEFNLQFPKAVNGNKAWVIEHEGKIPLPLAPKLSSPVMKISNTGPAGVELYVSFNVDNPNVFELPTPRLRFDYQLDGTSILRHRLNSTGPLAASSVSPVVFGILVYYHDVQLLLPYLERARSVESKLNLIIDFQIPAFADDNFTLEIPGVLPLNGRLSSSSRR